MPDPTFPLSQKKRRDEDEPDSFNAVARGLSEETRRKLFAPRPPDQTPTPSPTATPYQETPSNWREAQEYQKKREDLTSGTSWGDAIKRFFRSVGGG